MTARHALCRAALSTLALAAISLGAAGCGGTRPFLFTEPGNLSSLYSRGELTDRAGNRWNVEILPGVVSSVDGGAEAMRRSGRWMTRFSDVDYYEERGEDIESGLRFATEFALEDVIVEGIPRDLASTGDAISELAREAPFGWVLRIAGRSVLGYAILPVGRLALGTIGFAGGLGYAMVAPPLAIAGRPAVAAGNAALCGLALPAGKIAVHHPVYVAVILNREPALEHGESLILTLRERAAAASAP